MTTTVIRQNYHTDNEAGVNRQINMELYASYVYTSMAFHFDRDDVALNGFHKFFKELSDQCRELAEKLMKFQNMRGGRIRFQDIQKPTTTDWGTALAAMQSALELQKTLNQTNIDLHKIAENYGDNQMCDWLEANFLTERVECIKKIGNHITNLKRAGDGLGEYMFDAKTLG